MKTEKWKKNIHQPCLKLLQMHNKGKNIYQLTSAVVIELTCFS